MNKHLNEKLGPEANNSQCPTVSLLVYVTFVHQLINPSKRQFLSFYHVFLHFYKL